MTSPKNAIGAHWRSANAPSESTAIESSTSATATGATAIAARGAGPGSPLEPRGAALRGEVSSAMADIPTLSPMRFARQAAGLVVLALGPGVSRPRAAQSGDPSEDSPSGVIYEIPLDNARKDAAPTQNGGVDGSAGGEGTGAQGGTSSPLRSENGFGSSSTVPSAPTDAASGSGAAGRKSKSRKSDRADGSGAGGSGGSGGGGTGGSTAAGAPAESIGAATGATVAPSKSRGYLLPLLGLAVAAGLGIAGRYVARRR